MTKRKYRWLLVLTSCLVGVVGCVAKEPDTVSLTGIVYNYSSETIAFVKVDGKDIARGLDETPNGGVKGGSGMCCFELPVNAQVVDVEITLWNKVKFRTPASIEKWWPDLAHYGVVHILPGRKVVMQVTPSYPAPRKDLLELRQQELGLEKKVLFRAWSSGPIERVDGK
jgi:hypothetical protein